MTLLISIHYCTNNLYDIANVWPQWWHI